MCSAFARDCATCSVVMPYNSTELAHYRCTSKSGNCFRFCGLGTHLLAVACAWASSDFEGELVDDQLVVFPATVVFRGTMKILPVPVPNLSSAHRDGRFTIIVNLSAWCIWKGYCSDILGAEPPTSLATIAQIQTEMGHSLRYVWDSSFGSLRVAQERLQRFTHT